MQLWGLYYKLCTYVPHTQSVSIAEFAGPVVVEEVGEYVAVEHVVMDMEVIIKDSPMIFFLLCH